MRALFYSGEKEGPQIGGEAVANCNNKKLSLLFRSAVGIEALPERAEGIPLLSINSRRHVS